MTSESDSELAFKAIANNEILEGIKNKLIFNNNYLYLILCKY